MITADSKKSLIDLADFIAGKFSSQNVPQLQDIAKFEGIELHVDHHEDSFDEMLVFDNKRVHINLNIDRGNDIQSNRGQFSFAHALAHYFIDEHRIPLMTGKIAPLKLSAFTFQYKTY